MDKWGHKAQLQKKELPRSGIVSEIRRVRDKTSHVGDCVVLYPYVDVEIISP